MTETNYVASGGTKTERKMDEQPVKPQKPMSIDEYIKALRKEAEVAKLRSSIAESMFKENLAMVQLHQLKAGQIGHPPNQVSQEATTQENEDTRID